MLTFFQHVWYLFLYEVGLVNEDAHKQAPRGEIAATRYVSDSQKCVCGRCSAPDPAGELTALPRPPSWIWGPTSKEREGKGGDGGEGTEGVEERGGEGRRGMGRERKGP